MARWEIVHTPADLGRLLGVILELPALPATATDLATMGPLRTAVTRIAYGLAAGSSDSTESGSTESHSGASQPAAGSTARPAGTVAETVAEIVAEIVAGDESAAISVLNASAAAPPLVPALLPGGGTTVVAPTAAAALATIARDAVDLFGGPLARRIRVCAAEDCGLLFVDASRPGRRRGCSMQRCGNLAKVRSHRARRVEP